VIGIPDRSEQALGDPVIAGRVALGSPPGQNLRHVHDGSNARFDGGLGEVRGRFHDARHLNGVKEIGAGYPLQGLAYGLKIG
jgi:hypothetical protein